MEMRCRPKLADKSISIFTLYPSIYRTLPPRPTARFRKGRKHGWKVDVSPFFTFPHCNRWYTGYLYCPLFQLGTMHYLSCCSGCCFVGPGLKTDSCLFLRALCPSGQWKCKGNEGMVEKRMISSFPKLPRKTLSLALALSLAHALASTLVEV